MLTQLAVSNYRSLLNVVVPLGPLNLIVGPNGSGKTNLYRALRLLHETAEGGIVGALAREGGLSSTFWAGPASLSAGMKSRSVPVQGGPRGKVQRLKLGIASETFSYSISLGLPTPGPTKFALDPQIKYEGIWAGESYRPSATLVERKGPVVKARADRGWTILHQEFSAFDSILARVADPLATPESWHLRESIRAWRFYDHFRTDEQAPMRTPQVGTRTPVLHHDGRDLAAALETIVEIGDPGALHDAVSEAFPGARLSTAVGSDHRFAIQLDQEGLLRPLAGAELSDGTLRFLLWVAALLSPRPPTLMVLNEPETSLHPDLLPALARLIVKAAASTQLWVVSHSERLIEALRGERECTLLALDKDLGETNVVGQTLLEAPPWKWPDRG